MAGIVTAAVIGGAVSALSSVVGGIFGMSAAKKAQRSAAADKAKSQAELVALENNRQAIINPYDKTKDLSSLITDVSGIMTNPYANLGVATQAAEMKFEEADQSLANTLDTLRATGSGAGGATALAQAALQSKQGIAASIEQQEADNQKLKAQGETQLQQMKISEAQRTQGAQLSEGQRTQAADVAGKEFMFGAKETREVAKLDRVAGQLDNAQNRETQAKADRAGALTGMFGGIASAAGGVATAAVGGMGKK